MGPPSLGCGETRSRDSLTALLDSASSCCYKATFAGLGLVLSRWGTVLELTGKLSFLAFDDLGHAPPDSSVHEVVVCGRAGVLVDESGLDRIDQPLL